MPEDETRRAGRKRADGTGQDWGNPAARQGLFLAAGWMGFKNYMYLAFLGWVVPLVS